MAKFIALYMAPAATIAEMMQMPPDSAEMGMDAWMKWAEAHKADIVELGAPLGRTVRITADGTSDMKNEVIGYSIVEGASHAEAAKAFRDSPHFRMKGTWIELIECISMPGM